MKIAFRIRPSNLKPFLSSTLREPEFSGTRAACRRSIFLVEKSQPMSRLAASVATPRPRRTGS